MARKPDYRVVSMVRKPDYRVVANSGTEADRLVEIGVGFDTETLNDSPKPYIAVVLNARPWGEWDGKLQLHRIDK